jgi:hypothetical protein
MNTAFLKEKWAPNEHLVSFGTLMRLISRPCEYLQQEPSALIPSIQLGTDGPVLKGVVLLTDDYICEARLSESAESFDAALFNTVMNYRVDIGTHEIKPPEPPANNDPQAEKQPVPAKKVVYQTAQIVLVHTTFPMRTEMHYVGNDRETWLRNVRDALPVEILKKSRRT